MFPNEDCVPESVTMSVLLVMAKSQVATVSVILVGVVRVNSSVSSVFNSSVSR